MAGELTITEAFNRAIALHPDLKEGCASGRECDGNRANSIAYFRFVLARESRDYLPIGQWVSTCSNVSPLMQLTRTNIEALIKDCKHWESEGNRRLKDAQSCTVASIKKAYFEEAIEYYKCMLAFGPNSEAARVIADIYENDLDDINLMKAAYWRRKAAEYGDVRSKEQMSSGCGALVTRARENLTDNNHQPAVALPLLRQALIVGYSSEGKHHRQFSDAQMLLGFLYAKGYGVGKNISKAFFFYSLAKKHGHTNIDPQLKDAGRWNQEGNALYRENKFDEAYECYQWALQFPVNDVSSNAELCEKREAIFNVGWCYEYGKGVAVDKMEAARYYQACCEFSKAKGLDYGGAKEHLQAIQKTLSKPLGQNSWTYWAFSTATALWDVATISSGAGLVAKALKYGLPYVIGSVADRDTAWAANFALDVSSYIANPFAVFSEAGFHHMMSGVTAVAARRGFEFAAGEALVALDRNTTVGREDPAVNELMGLVYCAKDVVARQVVPPMAKAAYSQLVTEAYHAGDARDVIFENGISKKTDTTFSTQAQKETSEQEAAKRQAAREAWKAALPEFKKIISHEIDRAIRKERYILLFDDSNHLVKKRVTRLNRSLIEIDLWFHIVYHSRTMQIESSASGTVHTHKDLSLTAQQEFYFVFVIAYYDALGRLLPASGNSTPTPSAPSSVPPGHASVAQTSSDQEEFDFINFIRRLEFHIPPWEAEREEVVVKAADLPSSDLPDEEAEIFRAKAPTADSPERHDSGSDGHSSSDDSDDSDDGHDSDMGAAPAVAVPAVAVPAVAVPAAAVPAAAVPATSALRNVNSLEMMTELASVCESDANIAYKYLMSHDVSSISMNHRYICERTLSLWRNTLPEIGRYHDRLAVIADCDNWDTLDDSFVIFFHCGLYALFGSHCRIDYALAERLLVRAAELGYVPALYALGMLHFYPCVDSSYATSHEQAIVYFERYIAACEDPALCQQAQDRILQLRQNWDVAAYDLGMDYKLGRNGRKKDLSKARGYLERAVRSGHLRALQALLAEDMDNAIYQVLFYGTCLLREDTWQQNVPAALDCLERVVAWPESADAMLAPTYNRFRAQAMSLLALIYSGQAHSFGVPSDLPRAVMLWRQYLPYCEDFAERWLIQCRIQYALEALHRTSTMQHVCDSQVVLARIQRIVQHEQSVSVCRRNDSRGQLRYAANAQIAIVCEALQKRTGLKMLMEGEHLPMHEVAPGSEGDVATLAFRQGLCAMFGLGDWPIDYAQAVRFFERAAIWEYAPAVYLLGVLHAYPPADANFTCDMDTAIYFFEQYLLLRQSDLVVSQHVAEEIAKIHDLRARISSDGSEDTEAAIAWRARFAITSDEAATSGVSDSDDDLAEDKLDVTPRVEDVEPVMRMRPCAPLEIREQLSPRHYYPARASRGVEPRPLMMPRHARVQVGRVVCTSRETYESVFQQAQVQFQFEEAICRGDIRHVREAIARDTIPQPCGTNFRTLRMAANAGHRNVVACLFETLSLSGRQRLRQQKPGLYAIAEQACQPESETSVSQMLP